MKYLRKMTAWLLTLTMVMSLMVLPSGAADKFTVSASDATAGAGETVKVNLSVSNNTAMNSLTVRIYYKSDILTCTNVSTRKDAADNDNVWREYHNHCDTTYESTPTTAAKPSDDANISEERTAAGWKMASIGYTAHTSESFTGNGIIACLTFTVASDAESCETPIEVEVVKATDGSNADIDAASTTGKLTINGVKPTLNTVTLTPPSVEVDGTNSQTVQAAAASAKGTDLTSSVAWSVSGKPEGAGENDVTINTSGLITVDAKAAAGAYTITATPDGTNVLGTAKPVTLTVTRTPSALTKVELSPATVTISGYNDDATAHEVTATAYDQFDAPITSGVSWTVAKKVEGISLLGVDTLDTDVKVVDGTNKISVGNAAEGGKYTVTATYNGESKTAELTVERVPVAPNTVAVSEGASVLEVPVTGEVTSPAFKATVTDQFGGTDTSATVKWTLSGSDANISINEDTGVVTVKAEAKDRITNTTGETLTVTATSGGKSGTAQITIKRAASEVTTVTVSDGAATILVPADNAADIKSAAFTAKVYDQYGAEMIGKTVDWSIKDGETAVEGITIPGGVVTVANTAKGIITDTTGKTMKVVATVSGVPSDPVDITVKRDDPHATGIKFFVEGSDTAIPSDTIGIPSSGSTSKTYTAKAYDQYGAEMSGTPVITKDSGDADIDVVGGKVTVTWETTDGHSVTLKATSGSASGTLVVTAKTVEVDWTVIAAKSEITYGDTKASAFTKWPEGDRGTATAYVGGQKTTLNGTFEIVDKDTILEKGDSKTITVKFTVDENGGSYAGNEFTNKYTVKVNAKSVTVTAGSAKIGKTYDASTGAGVLTGALEVTGILNADSAVVKVAPTSIPVYTSADAHTENLTLNLQITGDTNGNYALQTTSISVPAEITKATLTGITTTVSPVTIKANDPKNTSSIVTAADNAAITLPTEVTVQYGAEKTTTLAIVWADATQTYNVKGNTYTFVGTTAASDNFSNRLPLTATLKVTPVTITAINGVPTALTKAKNEVTGSALTDVGFPAKVTLKFDSDVADMEIDATWNTAISALISAAGQVSSSNPSKTVTVTLTNTNFPAWATYSGTMPATSFTITNNYPVTVTVSVADKVYDGSPVTAPTPTVDEVDEKGTGDPTNAWKITYTGTTKAGVAYNSETAPKEAGDYTVTAVYDNGTHYGLNTDTFKITQREADLTWTEPSSMVYDGTAKEVTVAVNNLVGSDVCTVTATGTKATEVGAYTAKATGLSNANYKLPEVVTHNFTITEPVITVTPADAVSATRTGTTISVAGTVKADTPVTVAVGDTTFTLTVEGGKVKTTKAPEDGKFSIDVSGISILPGNVTVKEVGSATGVESALPQSIIDQAAALAGGSNATVEVKVEVDGNALKGAYTVTVGSEKKAEGALTTLTKPVTVNLTDSFAANQFVKYTVGGKTQYLPTSDNGGKASFQTSDLTGTFEVVTITDSVTITFNYFDGRVQTVTYTAADIGKALPTDSQSGYTFNGWTVNTGDKAVVLSSVTEELLKLNDQSVTPSFTRQSTGGGSSGGGVSTYSITVESAKNGTVTPSSKSARKGATVTITVKPDEGFELDALRVYDKDGNKIKVTEGKNGKYTFTMPASKVTVKATFAEIDTTWPFVDVADDFWARDAIAWAYENGYMNGNSTTTFNPGGSVTRQQLWMILARLSGERPASMAEAKAWAVENGISDGSNPGNAVSRQQMVTILYRYANLMGYKTSGSAALDIFPDSGKVAPYAQDAMAWSVANGIVGGTTQGTLNPAGTANRAQFATILQRFCKNIVEE